MKRFVITLVSISLISFAAFWFVSVPHAWQTELFRYTLFGVFLGVAFIMALYHVFLYAFTERERAYLLFAATCFTMLARFVTIEGGVASLLMTEYPPLLQRISLSILTAHGIFGIWFMHDTLRLPIGKTIFALYAICYSISFLGSLVFNRAYYLFIGLILHVVVVTKALRAPSVRKGPYKLTLVAGIALFFCGQLWGSPGFSTTCSSLVFFHGCFFSLPKRCCLRSNFPKHASTNGKWRNQMFCLKA